MDCLSGGIQRDLILKALDVDLGLSVREQSSNPEFMLKNGYAVYNLHSIFTFTDKNPFNVTFNGQLLLGGRRDLHFHSREYFNTRTVREKLPITPPYLAASPFQQTPVIGGISEFQRNCCWEDILDLSFTNYFLAFILS